MADTCKLVPTITVRKGKVVEEKDSKLFSSIKKAVGGDAATAWDMWAYTKTNEFKEKYKDKVDFDEFGEVTFPTLIKALGLSDVYEKERSKEEAIRDYGFNTPFSDLGTAMSKIHSFNAEEKKFVAQLRKDGDKYVADVVPRTGSTVEKAREQSYNYTLTGEIIRFLSDLGFSVEWTNDPKYSGLFDPQNATLKDGLLTVIKIAKGKLGEEALPEEFSHLIIEGLIHHPLVQRLLASLTEDQIENILGENFKGYQQEYDNDTLKLKKEAAGKLLGQHIRKQGTISSTVIQPKKPLLSRIWNWAKSIFSKTKDNAVDTLQDRASDIVANIYSLVTSKDVIPLIDKNQIVNADRLYKLREDMNSLEKIAIAGEKILSKRRKMLFSKKFTEENKDRIKKVTENLSEMQKAYNISEEGVESDNSYGSVLTFLKDTLTQLENAQKDTEKLKDIVDSKEVRDIKKLNEIGKVVLEINSLTRGYESILKTISTFTTEDMVDELNLHSIEEANVLAHSALECLQILISLSEWVKSTESNILVNAFRTQYSKDTVRGIGSKRDEIMALEQIIHHADRDINIIDRWFSAMSDADDALLTLFDGIIKSQQYDRDMEMIEWRTKIVDADNTLRKEGYNSSFMLERDADGIPTYRIISPYDWDAYNKEKEAEIKKLQEEWDSFSEDIKKAKGKDWVRKRYREWKEGRINGKPRLIRVFVDPKIEKHNKEKGFNKTIEAYPEAIWESLPNPEIYDANAKKYGINMEKLPKAQYDYYHKVLDIKRTMMAKIPHKGQGIYKTINISKSVVEGALESNAPISTIIEGIKRRYTRRPDDIGFGVTDDYEGDVESIIATTKDPKEAADKIIEYIQSNIDEDIKALLNSKSLESAIRRNKNDVKKATQTVLEIISSENFVLVDTDFDETKIQKLPVYYTRRLRDPKLLTEDFSSALLAYSAMAINYEKMDEVVNIIEVGRDYARNTRHVRESRNEKPIVSQYRALGKLYRSYVEVAAHSTDTVGRLDDYVNSVMYEEQHNSKNWNIFGVTLNPDKVLDTIKDYTGLLGLGLNIFSAFSNFGVGKLQQWIEAYAGEYFTLKSYTEGVKQYSTLIWEYLSEINSPIKKSKLGLLIQMFDPMGEYFEKLKSEKLGKNVTKILGNGVLSYLGLNAGEHALHCQTMLAILNETKLVFTKDTNGHKKGDKISLFDALEKKEVNGVTRLVLMENLAYEKDVIDYSGGTYKDEQGAIRSKNPNYGKPIKDENGKIKTELVHLKDKNTIKKDQEVSDEEKKQITNLRDYLFRKKRVIRKVNDSLNGAFNVNDKGAGHKWALFRLLMQYRQWMPAHYMRRFARAHYDNDLEKWREGYYVTVCKTLFQMSKEAKKAKWEALKLYKNLSEHEKANLRRANAEIAEFLLLMLMCRLGGRVHDRDRNWLERMSLYQLRRAYLEVGASMPFNKEIIDNILQILRRPTATIDTFEKFEKITELSTAFEEIQTGRYAGWTQLEKNAFKLVPWADQLMKAYYLDDSLFSAFKDAL